MRFLDRLLGRGPVLDAALEPAASFMVNTGDIDPAIVGLPNWTEDFTFSPRISRREAIQVPAVKRGRDLIAGTIGGLPLDVIDSANVHTAHKLLSQPERNVPRSVTLTRTVEDLVFEGVAWWKVVDRDFYKYPTEVVRLDPSTVHVAKNQKVYYRPDGMPQGSAEEWIPDSDLIRFDSPNDALLVAGSRAIRTAAKVSATMALYADEPSALAYFTPADGVDPEPEEVIGFLNRWKKSRKARITGYVPASLKLNQGGFSPEQLQLAEVLKYAVIEIANTLGIDSEAVNVSTTSRTYFNAEHKRREFVDFTLGPFIKAIEDRLSMGDVTKRGYYVRFNLDDFLRSDAKTRMETYKTGLEVGAWTQEEIRAEERKPALKALPAKPESETTVTNVNASQFSATGTARNFDAPAAAAEFKVDLESRTIRGLAVPYGVTVANAGAKWQFSKGSLKYDDVSRVKFLDGHDWSKPLGRAVSLEETDAGLIATFAVVATPAGDEALLMASEQVKDGLSISVTASSEFEERDGVFHAVSANLAHIALTPCPAFDDARVSQVAASAETEGNNMPETQAPAVQADNAAAFSAIAKAISDGFAALQPAQNNGPEVISAAGTAQFQVNEALPYAFNGRRAEHEFSTDLFAVARNRDGEAAERLNKFMAAAFVSKADVVDVNPTRQRPDLFVDGLDYVTPVWDMINKGSLQDGTPFVFPVYNTSGNLVGDHTEGQAPASNGTYTTTKGTVTPAPMSGKTPVVREVIDAGGNPQVSTLIWRQVVRAYLEALEAKAVALLDAATPTAITLTTGATGKALAGEFESKLARLHFVRGGNRFNSMPLQEDLYVALASARDDAGRPLYPSINPLNANGTVAADFGLLQIGGRVGTPAWALGATGTAVESSYLFSNEDVHGWATAPQRFDFDYKVEAVDIAVWGYQATAISRLAGVREITYDPVV